MATRAVSLAAAACRVPTIGTSPMGRSSSWRRSFSCSGRRECRRYTSTNSSARPYGCACRLMWLPTSPPSSAFATLNVERVLRFGRLWNM